MDERKRRIRAIIDQWLDMPAPSGSGSPYVDTDQWDDAILDGHFDLEKLVTMLAVDLADLK